MATKHHIGCHTKKSRIKYCEIILNRGCQCSGVATIFLVPGGTHKFFDLWGPNVIGTKFYFVKKKILNKCLFVRLLGENFVCKGYPRKTRTLVSHEQLWLHSILLKISGNANYKCWSVLRQIIFYLLKSVYFFFLI